MGCAGGHRCGLDLALLWLWLRQAAVDLTQSLAWELPYVTGATLKKKKKKKKEEKEEVMSDVRFRAKWHHISYSGIKHKYVLNNVFHSIFQVP